MNQYRRVLLSLGLSGVVLTGTISALAQDLPKKQPNLLALIREQVKVGHNGAHGRNEAGWPAAYEKAKSPFFYLAMTSITGPNEALYVIPYESHAAMGDDFKRSDDDPILSAETERLSLADAEHVNSVSTIHAAARPDLSSGDFPDLSKMRLFEITVYSVRPGHEQGFEAAGKAYGAARTRAGVKSAYRAYQVIAGMPALTYLVISSVKEFAEMDKALSDHRETMKAATEEEKSILAKAMAEDVLKEEANRYLVDPKQSYVPKETKEKDPDFWNKKFWICTLFP